MANSHGNMDKDHKIHCITKVPIFSHLSIDEMRVIARVATSKTFDAGEMIFFSVDEARFLYIIHKGMMKQVRVAASGREQIVRTLAPGEFIGELSLFSTKENEGYLEALESSEVCQIRSPDVQALLQEFPHIAIKIMEQLSNRLAGAEETIEQLGVHTVKQRLAHFLLQYADTQSGSEKETRFKLPFSKGDLASLLGTSQETLSRRLTELQEQGIITLSGQRTIYIHDKETIYAVAVGEK